MWFIGFIVGMIGFFAGKSLIKEEGSYAKMKGVVGLILGGLMTILSFFEIIRYLFS
jgi:hypothetical protein